MRMHFTCKNQVHYVHKVSIWLWSKSPFTASSLSWNINGFNCIGFAVYFESIAHNCSDPSKIRYLVNKIVENNAHTTNLAVANKIWNELDSREEEEENSNQKNQLDEQTRNLHITHTLLIFNGVWSNGVPTR